MHAVDRAAGEKRWDATNGFIRDTASDHHEELFAPGPSEFRNWLVRGSSYSPLTLPFLANEIYKQMLISGGRDEVDLALSAMAQMASEFSDPNATANARYIQWLKDWVPTYSDALEALVNGRNLSCAGSQLVLPGVQSDGVISDTQGIEERAAGILERLNTIRRA
jgi:hypothetical protein